MSPEFLLTSLIIVASPGTGAIYTIAAGLTRGSRASVLAAFACTLGIVPHLLAAMMGIAALLHASALAFAIVKYAGVAYLLYMAWQTLREHGALKVETKADARLFGHGHLPHSRARQTTNPLMRGRQPRNPREFQNVKSRVADWLIRVSDRWECGPIAERRFTIAR